jgi:hypothetical protein
MAGMNRRHLYFGTPSVTYADELIELKVAAEIYQLVPVPG